jgi:hypothetical protein
MAARHYRADLIDDCRLISVVRTANFLEKAVSISSVDQQSIAAWM